MSGAIPALLQYAFMTWCSVKSTGTLPLPLLLTTSQKTTAPSEHALSYGLHVPPLPPQPTFPHLTIFPYEIEMQE
jgi:hypothetical protein